MADAIGGGRPPEDPVTAAIADLASAVEANAEDERLLVRRLRRLSAGRAAGRSWVRLLDSEPDPGALALVGRILARTAGASGGFRRAVAQAARAEGETVADIARRFGVSHQRISTVLHAGEPTALTASPDADAGQEGPAEHATTGPTGP